MLYRKLPIEIEAFQIHMGMKISDTPEWFQQAIAGGIVNREAMTVSTLEGILDIGDGDYVIKGVQGELYPCKPDIFSKTYEPAD